jgi:hypothetical protein
VTRLLPWLLAVCLVCFVLWAALGIFEALTGAPLLARATPTPAFLPETEVRLVGGDGASVTVWQMDESCQVGNAFGQVPAGSEGRILAEACYSRKQKTTYHRIALGIGATGWVDSGDIVPAAEYTPPLPSPTATRRPQSTPRPTRQATQTRQPALTRQPTQTPPPAAPLPVGSSFSTGVWGVRVDKVEVAESLFSPAGDKVVQADGRFAVVFLTVTNQGFQPATLHASSVYIEDAEGNRYYNDDVASAYASSSGCLDYALDVGPDESACLVAAIEIPEQSEFYALSLYGAEESVLLDVP